MDEKSVAVDNDPEKTSLVDQNSNNSKIKVIPSNGVAAKTGCNDHDPESGVGEPIQGSAVRQVLAALVAQLGTINTGMAFGFSAIAIPQLLEADENSVHIDQHSDQESWIASMSAIGTPIGCLASGYLMDVFGRKRSLIITEIPALIGWVVISLATDIRMIYVGRFLTGLGSGMVGAPARVYTSEVTQPHLRGMLTAISSVGVSTGVLIEYALGSILSWKTCAAVSSVLPLAALGLMFVFPETPSYLVSRNQPDAARDSLKRFRGSSCNLDNEINDLINFSNKNSVKRPTTLRALSRAICLPNALKPFFILFLYFLIYQWSGTNAVTFYAVEIFKDSGVKWAYLATVILGVVRLLATIVACILCRQYGRRPLTMISSVGCGISMLCLGGYTWLKDHWTANGIQPTYTWVPLVCLLAYTVACCLGFLVIPWVMIGEIYPVQVRGVIGGLTTMSAHSFVFLVVKTFPLLRDAITEHGTFMLYGCISLVGTIYFWLFLPETKNKTLLDIEDYFSGRPSSLRRESLKPKLLEVKKGAVLPS